MFLCLAVQSLPTAMTVYITNLNLLLEKSYSVKFEVIKDKVNSKIQETIQENNKSTTPK